MSKPTVTQEQIDALLHGAVMDVRTVFDKVTVVSLKLPSGFVVTESSGAVSKENYSEAQGVGICLEKIKTRLWQLEGYRLQNKHPVISTPEVPQKVSNDTNEKTPAESLLERLTELLREVQKLEFVHPNNILEKIEQKDRTISRILQTIDSLTGPPAP